MLKAPSFDIIIYAERAVKRHRISEPLNFYPLVNSKLAGHPDL